LKTPALGSAEIQVVMSPLGPKVVASIVAVMNTRPTCGFLKSQSFQSHQIGEIAAHITYNHLRASSILLAVLVKFGGRSYRFPGSFIAGKPFPASSGTHRSTRRGFSPR
jgi:hypothetical protein